ncbi:MAG: transaldolase [Steroidobacteraceae bacterium]
MKPTQALHDLGQSLWLDNITRELLDSGTLARYIRDLSVTGLTSNPTIFDEAIGKGSSYDADIARLAASNAAPEDIFLHLAIDDLRRAADLFRPAFEATGGVDGWVSLEVSPLLAADTQGTVAAAQDIHARAARDNIFIKIPGTPAGVPAIEEAIWRGIPVNVTLLFSCDQYLAAVEAYQRGLERRLEAGRPLQVASVASLFISRWDRAVADRVPAALHNQLGLAVGQQCYVAYREHLASPRWRRLSAAGAKPQRLLWASTGVKDPEASETLYIEALAAPDTIDTMPEKTLLAFAGSGRLGAPLQADRDAVARALRRFADAGVDAGALALQLQADGAAAFVKSWQGLLKRIIDKSQPAKGAAAR